MAPRKQWTQPALPLPFEGKVACSWAQSSAPHALPAATRCVRAPEYNAALHHVVRDEAPAGEGCALAEVAPGAHAWALCAGRWRAVRRHDGTERFHDP